MKKKKIDPTDMRAIMNALHEDGSPKAITILLVACTGARPNEILKLTPQRISPADNTIKIHASKQGNNRVMPLPLRMQPLILTLHELLSPLSKPLHALICHNSASAYKAIGRHFESIQRAVLGEIRYTLKSFRHSLAIMIYQMQKDILDVQIALGHRSITSSAHYLADIKNQNLLSLIPEMVDAV